MPHDLQIHQFIWEAIFRVSFIKPDRSLELILKSTDTYTISDMYTRTILCSSSTTANTVHDAMAEGEVRTLFSAGSKVHLHVRAHIYLYPGLVCFHLLPLVLVLAHANFYTFDHPRLIFTCSHPGPITLNRKPHPFIAAMIHSCPLCAPALTYMGAGQMPLSSSSLRCSISFCTFVYPRLHSLLPDSAFTVSQYLHFTCCTYL